MDLSFGTSAYSRERGNFAELPVVNMFAEASPVDGRVVLQSFPGLQVFTTLGDGPMNGLFKRDGVLAGQLCAVSGASIYVGANNVGGVTGGGYVSFAGDEEELTVCAGSDIVQITGGTVSTLADPTGDADITDIYSGAGFAKLFDLAGYHLAIENYSGRVWFRQWGVPWQGFFTAEAEPDRLLDGLGIDDYLILFGAETVEFWPVSGDAELPFQPLTGRVFEKGIRATGCAAVFDNTAAWVSKDNIVYRAGNVPERISDNGIEERLGKSATCRVDALFFEGHELLQIRGDTFTMVYDAQTGEWCERQSYGMDNFKGLSVAPGGLFGDSVSGKVFINSDDHRDDGGVFERRFRAGSRIEGIAIINNIRVQANVGQTPNLDGAYSAPVVEMRSSRDAGQTWGAWRASSLGATGQYRNRVEWRRCGMFDEPGMLFEFRVTDPVPFRVSAVQANARSGGRAR